MKKKVIKVVLILIMIFLAIYIVAEIDIMKQTRENAKKSTEWLMDSISKGNYEQIKLYINKPDGTELTDEQISNFLLNTGLYRATIGNSGIVSFTANTSFFTSDKANVIFSYKTLSGEIITNELEYSHTKGLMTEKIQETNKTREKLPIALDLENGDLEFDSLYEESFIVFDGVKIDGLKIDDKLEIMSFIKDENDKVFIEIIEEAKKDLKIKLSNNLYNEINSLKETNENYDIVWDNEYKQFSIYYNEQLHNSDSWLFGNSYKKYHAMIFGFSALSQCLDGESDWRLTINYYDYDNNKLLKTETIR